jgi:hypothetical protein
MKKKQLRQAIRTSPNELRKLADLLEKEISEVNDSLKLGLKKYQISKKYFIYPIINKTPECSDTWEFEE